LVLVLLFLLALVGGSWYYADQIRADLLTVTHDRPQYTIEVLDVDESRIVLERTERTARPGVQGLEWAHGYGQMSTILHDAPDGITREFRILRGSLAPGDLVRVRSWAYPGDPLEAFGIDFREVRFSSDLPGDFPAWLVEGDHDTWAVLVHGKGAPRTEFLRLIPILEEAGYPTMVITYRNDPEAPGTEDRRYRFGDTEWREVEGAVRFALDRGARDLVLVGYSTGGAIAVSFMDRSDLADHVRGLILDAPLLDVSATVDHEGSNRGLPRLLTSTAKWLSSVRFGVDWRSWDQVPGAAAIDVPILLFHADGDRVNPIGVSDRLAEQRPHPTTYVRVSEGGHVESWNVDPERYAAAVRGFLEEVAR
jgi:uncharacterized protein